MNSGMKTAFALALLFGALSFAQDHPAQTQTNNDRNGDDHSSQNQGGEDRAPKNQSATTNPRASCGPATVQFEVRNEKKTEKKHPLDGPAPNQALVYVVENLRAGCFLCDTTTKIGLDGNWVGATKGNSYFSFPLGPGEHHLCASLQSDSSGPETTSLAGFSADAGATYYFRARLTDQNNSGKGGVKWALDLDPLDSDQAQFMIDSYEQSSYRKKK
jgi:hypothetical protein